MCRKLIYLISFVLVLGLTTTSAGQDIAEGLVAYWPLDEGGGTTTEDLTGNGSDGTFVDAPAWVSGKFGGALDFDGSNDAVNCGNQSILDFGTGDWTVSAWIKVGTTPSGDVTIYGKGGDHTSAALPGVRYQMMLDSGNYIHPVVDDDSNKYDPHGNITVIDGQWHHIVMMRRDGTKFRVYVDGVDDMGVTNHGESTLPANYDLSGTSLFNAYIGAVTHAGNSTPSTVVLEKHFGGLIDDVAVWSRALTVDEISYLWNDGIGNPIDVSGPGQASNPYPADEQADVPRDVVLSWTPGEYATTHDVYFGTVFDDVNDAIGGITQSANSYDPGRLDFGTTYYWRVDEVNAPPEATIFKGTVWQFTSEPIGYPIANITATASSNETGKGPENTVNGSGLDEAGLLHSKVGDDNMWLSSLTGPQPTWIQYEFDKVYKLHEMWVWNFNESWEPAIGAGLNDVSIEYSVDSIDYATLGTTHEFAQGPGVADYAHNTTVDLGGVPARYVRLTANSNFGGILAQYGLSEVRFFYIPVNATEPNPDSGATDVNLDVVLGWRAGREAAEHDVHLGTDEQVVRYSSTPVATASQTQHGPLSLDLGQTYYWKINEVNMAETPTMWEGDLWNFATPEYLVVDDFEDYNDYPPDEVWATWIDGYGVVTNGSTAGYPSPNFLLDEHYVETALVHGGDQSMPLFYDNTGGAAYSEAERTFAVGQDWTKHGVRALSLWFYGDPNNAVGQMYVKLNGSKVVYGGDPGAITRTAWQPWNIDLASFGVDLANVTTVAIGFERSGPLGGSGIVYFDDIRLYPYSPELITPVQPNSAGLVGQWEFEGNVNDSSGNANHGTLNGSARIVPDVVPERGQVLETDQDDGWAEIPHSPLFDMTERITVAAWIKAREFDDGNARVICKGDNRWRLRRDGDNQWMEFNLAGVGEATGKTNVNDGEWHHTAGTYDGMTVRLYIDGFEDASSAEPNDTISTDTGNLFIGIEDDKSDDWNGWIDDVRVYDYALSHAEVAWLTGRTGPFDKPF